MANVETSYFFPPQWHFRLGGPISLGNILSNPQEPQYALNDENKEALPPLFINDTKPQFKATISADTARSAGIGSSLLQLFGFSADLNVEHSKKRSYTIDAEQMLTQEINPKSSYVETCFKHAEVQAFLQRTKFRKDLYMIVGVMSVTSATVSTDVGKRHLFGAKVGASLAPVTGLPLDVHVSGSTGAGKETQASFGKSDFVLAYKLRKITYSKIQKVTKMEGMKKGTVLDDDDDDNGVAQVSDGEDEEAIGAEFVRLEEGKVGSEDFELAGVQAQVEGVAGGNAGEFELVLPVYAEDE